jgi:hypothetical protein
MKVVHVFIGARKLSHTESDARTRKRTPGNARTHTDPSQRTPRTHTERSKFNAILGIDLKISPRAV